MRLLVLDNYESFTLVPYLKERLEGHEVLKMGNIYNEQMWSVFRDAAPDAVFVDFADTNLSRLTARVGELTRPPRIVARLHGFEAHESHLSRVDWGRVSDLVVVSRRFLEIVGSRLEGRGVRVHLVHNGIDLDRFGAQAEIDLDRDSIAYVGYLNKKKGPALLRTVMASWPEKRFHVGGANQDEHVERYFGDLPLANVTFHGWVRTEEFLRGKGFVISTSVTESFGMSIAEGMAMGLTPLVHAWPGAELLWPEECIWRTFDELRAIRPLDPGWCRRWVADRYPIGRCVDEIVRLLGFR